MGEVSTKPTRNGVFVKILHLSDTPLSGAPYRASQLLNKYSGHESRHIVWKPNVRERVFPSDMIGSEMTREDLNHWLSWADIVHYHNRWKRQKIHEVAELPNGKKSVIQIHSPRDEKENYFKYEVESKIPIAVIAQYHVRQWPELKYIVPNVVDIHDGLHKEITRKEGKLVTFGYAPSSPTGKGWDDKSYHIVNPILKGMYMNRKIYYKRIVGKPFVECVFLKRQCDIGVDEVSTGSYHMSSLEFLSMGIATIAYIDEQTEKVVKDLTGASDLPWVVANEASFKPVVDHFAMNRESTKIAGQFARTWMEKYWSPGILCGHLLKMYEDL